MHAPTLTPAAVLPLIVAVQAAAGRDAPDGLSRMLADAERGCPIPVTDLLDALDACAARKRDPIFGLRLGASLRTGAFGVLDFAVRSAPSIGEALRRLCCYYGAASDAGCLELERDPPRLVYVGTLAPERTRHTTEFLFGYLVRSCASIAQAEHAVRAVVFPHGAPPPASVAEAARLLHCPVTYGGESASISFASGSLERALVTSDEELSAFARPLVESIVKERRAEEPVIQAARRFLRQSMAGRAPDVDLVARRLRMSRRTLQRKLTENGVSFSQVLDEVRRTTAEQLLGSGRGVTETALTLGFSDVSTFSRAFRRWTGASPSRYRADRQASSVAERARRGGSSAERGERSALAPGATAGARHRAEAECDR